METRSYQAVVVGAGPGGYPCAIRLAQLGVKVLCIEKANWGGVCLNEGCIPSKALITAGKRVKEIQHADVMGIIVDSAPRVDMPRLIAWKDGIVKKLTGGVNTLLKNNGAERLIGHARFEGPGSLIVDTADGQVRVQAPHIVIATGSKPIQIPGFSFADNRVLDAKKALDLQEIPKHLAVIGGGYIGLELGGMMAKVGSKVTVIEMTDSLLPGFDPEVVKLLARQLKKDGVQVRTKTRALGWEEGDGHAILRVQGPDGNTETLEVDRILVTVGRFPLTEDLGLDKLPGLAMSGRFIQIDKQCKTNLPGLYAIGDVAGQPMLAHKATHEGEVCAEVIAGHKVFLDHKQVPAVVFTDPEVATAGMQEHEARAAGYELKIGRMPFAALGRAMTTGETEGFVKVILDAKDERVLGVTIVGPHASDLISEASLAIEMDAEALDIGLTIHPHPTLGEAIMEASKHARGEAVHVMNK